MIKQYTTIIQVVLVSVLLAVAAMYIYNLHSDIRSLQSENDGLIEKKTNLAADLLLEKANVSTCKNSLNHQKKLNQEYKFNLDKYQKSFNQWQSEQKLKVNKKIKKIIPKKLNNKRGNCENIKAFSNSIGGLDLNSL